MLSGATETELTRVRPEGGRDPVARALACEVPIAIEVGGFGYAVMMATPEHLEDFAIGFCLAERLVDAGGEVLEVDPHETARGVLLRVTIAPERRERVGERVRHRTAESSCGLCGIESLEQALRPLPRVTSSTAASPTAIFRALDELRAHQPLNRVTGAVHAAALCGVDGAIRLVREDVGRHNAMDKLVGAMARQGLGWDGGFALLSARCSFELVEKAALANCPMLVTISLATDLAVKRAAEAGLTLVVLARPDSFLEVKAPTCAP